jgi:hypothetical protein
MKWRIAILLLSAIIVAGGIYCWHEYEAFNEVPATRLVAGSYYFEMPPDEYHHYMQIPIDHQDPSLGNFTDFYILNPEFRAGDNVIF